MELQQIRYFLSACETLSYVETAKVFHVSRQAVSGSINALSKELGIQLFERSHNKMVLTSEAEEFALRCRKTNLYFNAIEEEFSGDVPRPLSLVIDSFLMEPNATVLQSLGEYAKMDGSCVICFAEEPYSRAVRGVVRRQYDIGIIRTMSQLPLECEGVVMRTAKVACFTALDSDLAQRKSVSFADLDDYQFIVAGSFDLRYPPFAYVSTGQVREKISPIDEKNVATNAVRMGFGVGLTDYVDTPNEKPVEGVVRIPFDEDFELRDYLFYRADHPRLAQITHFVDWFIGSHCWSNWGISHL